MSTKRSYSYTNSRNVRPRLAKPTMRLRSAKPEMKAGDMTISHTGATASNTELVIAQGTDVNNRIGNKVKVWRIQGVVNTGQCCRVEILIPNVTTASPSNTAAELYSYGSMISLGTYILNAEGASNAICTLDHKLPLGVVCTYNGSLGTDIVRNRIVVRITTATAINIAGEFRIYFTDN